MKDLVLSWPIKSRGLNRVPLFLDQYSLHICMIRLSAPSIVLVYHLLRLFSFHFCQITRSHNNDTHVWLQKITVKRSKTGVPHRCGTELVLDIIIWEREQNRTLIMVVRRLAITQTWSSLFNNTIKSNKHAHTLLHVEVYSWRSKSFKTLNRL